MFRTLDGGLYELDLSLISQVSSIASIASKPSKPSKYERDLRMALAIEDAYPQFRAHRIKIVDNEDNFNIVNIFFKPLPDLSTYFKRGNLEDSIFLFGASGVKDFVDILEDRDIQISSTKLRIDLMNITTYPAMWSDLQKIFGRCLGDTTHLSLGDDILPFLDYAPQLESLGCSFQMTHSHVEWLRQHRNVKRVSYIHQCEQSLDILPALLKIPHIEEVRLELVGILDFTQIDVDKLVASHVDRLNSFQNIEMVVKTEQLIISKCQSFKESDI